jgi:hypothetical protein
MSKKRMGYSSIKMRTLITKHPQRSLMFRKMILSRSVNGAKALSITPFSITTLSIKGVTKDTQHK